MIKRLERLKNTANKYMADLQPDQHTTYQSERKLVVSRRPGVFSSCSLINPIPKTNFQNSLLKILQNTENQVISIEKD
jgi:hypothetical protein